MPRGYNLDDVTGTTLNELSSCLSGMSQQLLLNLIGGARDRYQWQPMTDGEWDTLDALFAETEGKLMHNCAVGTIVHLVTKSTPANILWCDGTTYNRVDYPDLYAVLPPVYIVDADQFTVPDLRSKFIRNIGNNNGLLGQTGGNANTALNVGNLPPHTHTYTRPTSNIDVESVGIPDPTGVGIPFLPLQTGSTGSGNSFSNQPPFHNLKAGIIAK